MDTVMNGQGKAKTIDDLKTAWSDEEKSLQIR